MSLRAQKRLIAWMFVAGLGTSCQNSSQISSADGEKGGSSGNNSSTGLGNLGNEKPDAGSHIDPPDGLKPFGDTGALPDTAIKEEKCAGDSQMAKQVPIDLLLLVDRSGSMNNRVSPGGKTKWELAQNALGA